ncbi:MAG: glycosyltransferase family 2 protein [Muribaculaceae bacterium]|nr:glycosyltransferase family 2 protein [Muribaculaceae bacterium]
MKPITLAIVAPCFNEQEMLPISAPKLIGLLDELVIDSKISPDSFIIFVNDGSSDSTWNIIKSLHLSDNRCRGLDLSRNVGHQNAIMAGMDIAVDGPDPADAVITIDVDLQDPLECIPLMIDDFYKGFDVVYGVRASRNSDSFLKRFSAESFYRLQKKLGVKTIFNHADFRLMSARVIRELQRYNERNLFLRGIIPLIGFPASTVEEVRAERTAGETKYTLRKMLRLALDGITSFSITPIYIILGIGICFIFVAFAIMIYVLISLLNHSTVPGWTSLMLSIWLVGGVTIASLGLVGLYVGKAYIETKNRPRYHISGYLH